MSGRDGRKERRFCWENRTIKREWGGGGHGVGFVQKGREMEMMVRRGGGLAVGFSSNVLRVDNYVLFTKLCCFERE